MTGIYEEMVRGKSEGKEAALVTIISTAGSTPRAEGAKMLVKDSDEVVVLIGGGPEALVCERARNVIE